MESVLPKDGMSEEPIKAKDMVDGFCALTPDAVPRLELVHCPDSSDSSAL